MTKKSMTKTVNVPDGKTLAVLNDEELRMLETMKGKLTSRHMIEFKEGVPVKKDEMAELLSHAVIMEICKSTSGNGAMQIIENAAAGQYWNHWDTNLAVALAQMADLEPRNALEALLAAQMVAVNAAIGKTLKHAMLHDQTLAGREINTNLATKLQRTFLAQVDTLQKLRGKGQQSMRIEHVTVNEGGRAVVGHVEHTIRRGEGEEGKG
jgi:hypothetical protein